MAQCVFCQAVTGLNTQIAVKLDDGIKVSCDICDEHADEATPKTVKAAYLARQAEADALIAKLKAMGYDVAKMEQKGSIIVPVMAEKPKPSQVLAESVTADELSGDGVVDTSIVDSRAARGVVSANGSAQFVGGSVSVAGYTSLDAAAIAANNLPVDQRNALSKAMKGKAKLTVVEGREGQPLTIVEKRVDGLGTTRIKVSKREDDTRLQSRFKKMAKDSTERGITPNFATEGYQNTQVDCPICRGNCVIVSAGKEISCPKCNGAGFISRY